MQRQGKYPPPQGASDILGLELSGVVVAVGADVVALARRRSGDRARGRWRLRGVCGGAEVQCLPVPRGLSMEEAAALPETFFTVWTQRVRARPAGGRRIGADSRRRQRHRDDRDPARPGARRTRVCDGRVA